MHLLSGSAAAPRKFDRWIIPCGATIFVLALMSDVLFRHTGQVFAADNTDMAQLFIPWRTYGFGRLRQGHWPFWTPHVYSGMPFLANPQTAMLYPFNAIYLLLDPIAATNICIALHLIATMIFTSWWGRLRGADAIPALFGGLCFTCSAPLLLHLYPGHLTYLCATPWIALIFVCLDQIIDRPPSSAWGYTLLGIFACSMLLLCGYPQFAVYTAVIAGAYFLLRLRESSHWRSAAALGMLIALIGAGISAAQLLPSYDFTALSSRSAVLAPDAAASYSLTLENLLTLLVPAPLGDMVNAPYVGRWYFWEQSIWVGLGVLILALLGALSTKQRQARIAGAIALVCILFALGDHTPLFWLLYHAPIINRFRAPARLGLFSALMLSMLASQGAQVLLNRGREASGFKRSLKYVVLVSALIALGLGCLAAASGSSTGAAEMSRLIDWIASFHTSAVQQAAPATSAAAASWLARQAAAGAVIALAMAALIGLSGRYSVAATLAVALAAGQVIFFAFSQRVASTPVAALPPAWSNYLANGNPDQRVLATSEQFYNGGDRFGYDDIWGYDAVLLRRYTQFMAITQDDEPSTADYKLQLARSSHLFDLLRCAAVLTEDQNFPPVMRLPGAFPRVALFGRFRVCYEGDDVWNALANRDFDMAHVLVLESPPSPPPVDATNPGAVVATDRDDESVEITADLSVPQLLLITDVYAPGWQATVLAAGPQDHYDVLPADNALRAIPLAAGHHHILMQYTPPGWIAGCWVSAASLLAYLTAIGFWLRRGRAAHASGAFMQSAAIG